MCNTKVLVHRHGFPKRVAFIPLPSHSHVMSMPCHVVFASLRVWSNVAWHVGGKLFLAAQMRYEFLLTCAFVFFYHCTGRLLAALGLFCGLGSLVRANSFSNPIVLPKTNLQGCWRGEARRKAHGHLEVSAADCIYNEQLRADGSDPHKQSVVHAL